MIRDLNLNLRDLNQECKAYFLKNDINLTSIVIGAAVLMVPPLSYLDYTYYGFSVDFFVAGVSEALFVVFSILLIIYLSRINQVKTYETLVFAWGIFLALATPFADFLQPTRITENVLISELLIIAFYMLIANRFIFRIIPIATITFTCITALFATTNLASFQEKYLFTITLILLNGAGIVVLSRNNRFKRVEYEAINREKEARRLFEELAGTDSLTGILNRRSFIEHTRLALHRFERYNNGFCLAILDIDNLKEINDTRGHLAGDQAIKQLTHLVESKKRIGDIFGRLGGDEFGFIFQMSNQTSGQKIISRLQDALQALIVNSPSGDFHISFSAGVAEVTAEDKSPDDLIHRADMALYESKSRKRNQPEKV